MIKIVLPILIILILAAAILLTVPKKKPISLQTPSAQVTPASKQNVTVNETEVETYVESIIENETMEVYPE